ncbi:MAG: SPFH domain-containing protein [Cyanobacteria bacterium P01_C01_bin.89]
MDTLLALIIPLLAGAGYFAGSARVIEQGNKALVERLGRYHRLLDPGLNFVVPFVDSIIVETVRERTTDIQQQSVITRDELKIEVDAAVYWQIVDLKSAYYNVDDLSEALNNLVLSEVRALFGQVDLAQSFSQIESIQRMLLERLDEVTTTWGIKVLRVVLQEIKRPPELDEAIRQEKEAESNRRAAIQKAEGDREAAIAEAEGRKRAAIAEAEGIVQATQLISSALQGKPVNSQVLQQVVQFLVAQRYVDANQKLGESPNSKVLFMDPRALNEAITDLVSGEVSGVDGAGQTSPKTIPPGMSPETNLGGQGSIADSSIGDASL